MTSEYLFQNSVINLAQIISIYLINLQKFTHIYCIFRYFNLRLKPLFESNYLYFQKKTQNMTNTGLKLLIGR